MKNLIEIDSQPEAEWFIAYFIRCSNKNEKLLYSNPNQVSSYHKVIITQ